MTLFKDSNFSSDIIYIYKRDGSSSNPYVDITETITVNQDRVFLKEIPDNYSRVIVKVSGSSTMLNEVSKRENIATSNDYFVDYNEGIVYFVSASNGRIFDFKYKGRGAILYPASRIYTGINNSVVETLQDAINKSLNSASEANAVLAKVTKEMSNIDTKIIETTNQGNYAKTQGDYAKAEGGKLAGYVDEFKVVRANAIQATNDTITATNNTNIATENAKKATDDAVEKTKLAEDSTNLAIDSANIAKERANLAEEKAELAETQSIYAKEQGDYAKQQGDNISAVNNEVISTKENVKNMMNEISKYKTDSEVAVNNANKVIDNINESVFNVDTVVKDANKAILDIGIVKEEVEEITQETINIIDNFVHKDEFDESTTYVPMNIVNYEGASYINISESTGISPTDNTKWKVVSSRGEKGERGERGERGEQGERGEKGQDGLGSVISVNGMIGEVTLSASDVGALSDNTKIPTKMSELDNDIKFETIEGLQEKIDKSVEDSKSYTDEKVSSLINSAPETLDTLNELSQALGNDPNFATTVLNEIGTKETPENAQAKADKALEDSKSYIDNKSNEFLEEAKLYTDTEVSSTKEYIDNELRESQDITKVYINEETDKVLIDAKNYTNNETNKTLSNAKIYTDNLISSINESGVPSLAQYPYVLTATEDYQKDFVIPLETFDKYTDALIVSLNRNLLDTSDYTISEKTLTLNDISEVSKGSTLYIHIFKNVPVGKDGTFNGANLADNTVPLSKLEPAIRNTLDNIRNNVNEISDELIVHKADTTNPHNVTSKQVNVIPAKSINDNASLYPEGFSVFYVSPNNANHTEWANTAISLGGSNSNVSGYMISVETLKSGSNGASQTMTAISNFVSTLGKTLGVYKRAKSDYSSKDEGWGAWIKVLTQDDYDKLFQYANDGKTGVANAVTAKGVSASPSDTFATLASKIGQISTGENFVAGSNQVIGNSNVETPITSSMQTYTKLKEIKLLGNFTSTRISFDLRYGSSYAKVKVRIYKNGQPVGTDRASTSSTYVTYTEDIVVEKGDLIQLYGWHPYQQVGDNGANGYVRNFTISADLATAITQVIS